MPGQPELTRFPGITTDAGTGVDVAMYEFRRGTGLTAKSVDSSAWVAVDIATGVSGVYIGNNHATDACYFAIDSAAPSSGTTTGIPIAAKSAIFVPLRQSPEATTKIYLRHVNASAQSVMVNFVG